MRLAVAFAVMRFVAAVNRACYVQAFCLSHDERIAIVTKPPIVHLAILLGTVLPVAAFNRATDSLLWCYFGIAYLAGAVFSHVVSLA